MTDDGQHPGTADASSGAVAGPAHEVRSTAQRPTAATGLAQPSRRGVVLGALAVVGAGTLAACGATADDGTAGGGSAGSGGGGAPGPSGTSGSTGTEQPPLVALADVPVGGAVAARTASGAKVLVAQPEPGTVVCFSAVCTHLGCTVAPKEDRLVCPCHASVFDVATGEVLDGPAPEPLPPVAVEVRDGQVVEA